MGYNLLINGVYWGYNPLILTFYDHFQWAVQVDQPKVIWGDFGQPPPMTSVDGWVSTNFQKKALVKVSTSSPYHGPPKPRCLEVFMVNTLVFRWPKPLVFMVLGAHGSCQKYMKPLWYAKPPQRYTCVIFLGVDLLKKDPWKQHTANTQTHKNIGTKINDSWIPSLKKKRIHPTPSSRSKSSIFYSFHHMSSVQNPYDVPWNTGWLIVILTKAHYNPLQKWVVWSHMIPIYSK